MIINAGISNSERNEPLMNCDSNEMIKQRDEKTEMGGASGEKA